MLRASLLLFHARYEHIAFVLRLFNKYNFDRVIYFIN